MKKPIKIIFTTFTFLLFFFCWAIVFNFRVLVGRFMTPDMAFFLWFGCTIIALVSTIGYLWLFFFSLVRYWETKK